MGDNLLGLSIHFSEARSLRVLWHGNLCLEDATNVVPPDYDNAFASQPVRPEQMCLIGPLSLIPIERS